MSTNILQLYETIDKIIVSGKDCQLFDSDGKNYVDFEAGDWAAILGHSNQRISQIIKNQTSRIIHDGLRFRNIPSEELAKRILELVCFNNGRCVFLNSGSEAVNFAISLAMKLTKRKKCLKIDCTYLSAYGYGQISDDNECLLNIPIDQIGELKSINFEDVAAFVFEPGNSRGLIRFPSNEFINAIAYEVKNHNGILIANEVTTGFGRTGKWFGYNHYDYEPDIVVAGKALGNGYPISCVAINDDMTQMFSKVPFRYAQSHQNDPLGCAIGIEVIESIREMNLINRSATIGNSFHAKLSELKRRYPTFIKDVRSRGLMLTLEFCPSINCKDMYMSLLEKGFVIGYRDNVLRFMPPLIITEDHFDNLIDTITEIFNSTIDKE